MKKLPVGIDDFREIVQNNYYYIDKTKFIEAILNDGGKVQLFIRPRRFGKTLNMSTLKYFFDIESKEENKKLFKGLYIEKSALINEQGKYPVIFISMKGVKGDSYKKLKQSLVVLISNIFEQYKYLRNSLDERDLMIFDKIWKREDTEYRDSLLFLTRILKDFYKENVVVLIDEYDAPLLSAYEYNYYDKAVEFFKELYGAVLKTNINLKIGVMTGAIRVAQAGIFSDLNNLSVNTILNKSFDEYFGLLEREVEYALKDYKIQYRIADVKSWYDGYKFGDVEVYNPWSVINYIKEKELKAYWINTSGNFLIRDLLVKADAEILEKLQSLMNKDEIIIEITENIPLGRNLGTEHLWELMLFSGYLTIKEKISSILYTVKVPNEEVNSFFKYTFVDILFNTSRSKIGNIIGLLINKNILSIIEVFQDILINAVSYYDLDKRYENSYHMLFTGFFYGLSELYTVFSNVETGFGRADLVLKAKNNRFPSYIFEFKKSSSTHLEEDAKKAYEQILDKKYESILTKEEIKNIIKIGLAFDGKEVKGFYSNII